MRMKHDYCNIISAAAGDRSAAVSPTDNIVWLEHIVYIDLSIR